MLLGCVAYAVISSMYFSEPNTLFRQHPYSSTAICKASAQGGVPGGAPEDSGGQAFPFWSHHMKQASMETKIPVWFCKAQLVSGFPSPSL